MLQAGDRIDIWVVERALGAGGMGSVYRCHNHAARRILAAVKVLDVSLRTVAGARERFVREAEILFQLDHPSIVKVRNVRTDTDPPYLEMEYVVGESLEKVLERGPLPLPRALDLMDQLLSAIDHLHTRGIRHRDIKPANVLIRRDGTLKLVDFGLAVEADVTRITQQGMTFGTVSYAPPEWIAPDRLDAVAWDLYAAGVVFYEIIVGGVAFPVSGGTTARQQAMQVMLAKQNHAPLDPGEAFPDAVRSLVRDLSHGDVARRLGRADVALNRLRAVPRDSLPPLDIPPLDEPTVETAPITWVDPTNEADATLSGVRPAPHPTLVVAKVAPRRWWPLVLGGIALALVLGSGVTGGLGLWWMGQQAASDPRPVSLVVAGLAQGTPVTVRVDGTPVAAAAAPWTWDVSALEPGVHEVTWAVGDGCGACPEPCPVWCGVGARSVEVPPGDGVFLAPLELTAPSPRVVHVAPTGLPAEVPLAVWLDGAPLVVEDGRSVGSRLPGPAEVVIVAGACPPEVEACAPGACAPGCAAVTLEVEVPWDASIVEVAPAMTWVGPASPPQTERPNRPGPEPDPAAGPAGAGALVTVREFAAWLGDHPDWMRDAALSAGRADALYLEGWSGASPPGGATGAPVTSVSWYAASAFCRSRGGLAALDAPPITWTEGPAPAIEWRVDGARAAWRTSDGTPSTTVNKAQALAIAGFRCAR